MATIHKAITIDVPYPQVWDALVDPNVISKWGGGPVEMADREGFEFKLWGGDIHGKNIKVIDKKELVQEWFSEDWIEPSIVVFKLHDMFGKTIVKLEQTNIPQKDQKSIDEGWDKYYLGAIKKYLEQ